VRKSPAARHCNQTTELEQVLVPPRERRCAALLYSPRASERIAPAFLALEGDKAPAPSSPLAPIILGRTRAAATAAVVPFAVNFTEQGYPTAIEDLPPARS
jgi:hypothetical protein